MQNQPQVSDAMIDLLVSRWEEQPERLAMTTAFAAAIKDKVAITAGMKCLEFGCGRGNLALMLPETISIVASDPSEEGIEVLKQKIAEFKRDNISPRQADFLELPENDHFDLIYSTLALHHIKDVTVLMQKCARLLNERGQLVIIDLDKEDGTFHDDNSLIHHFGFDRRELQQKFEEAGFEPAYMAEVYRREKVFADGRKRSYPLFIAVTRKRN